MFPYDRFTYICYYISLQSKVKGNDKALTQSHPTSHTQNQKGKQHINKLINFYEGHAH